jgi:hypothetical protein
MLKDNKILNTIGLILFGIGVVTGMVFYAGAVWSDLEASLFNSSLQGDEALNTLVCPLVISSSEKGVVKANFTNNTEKAVNIRTRTNITEGLVTLVREIETITPVEVGETEYVQWEVGPEDAAWNRFILVRVYQFRAFQVPSRSGSCGIIVIDLFNLNGNLTVILFIALCIIGMIGGGFIWLLANRPLRRFKLETAYAMGALLIVVMGGIIASAFGHWVIGGALLIFNVLLLAAILSLLSRSARII